MTAPPAASGTDGQASAPRPLVEQFLTRAEHEPRRVVIRRRTADLWFQMTAAEVATAIGRTSQALRKAGVAEYDYVALVGAASTEWLIAELACQYVGVATVVFVGDERSAVPPPDVASKIRAVILVDSDREVRRKRQDRLASIDGLAAREVLHAADVIADNAEISSEDRTPSAAESAATIIRTYDGGHAVYSAVTYAALGALWRETFTKMAVSPADRITPATRADFWIGRVLMLELFGTVGPTFYFVSEATADAQALREIRPTIWWSTARSWLKLTARVRAQMLASGRVARMAYGRDLGDHSRNGRAILASIRNWLIVKPLLNQLGLRSVRVCLVLGDRAPKLAEHTLNKWGLEFIEFAYESDVAGPSASRAGAETAAKVAVGTVADPSWATELSLETCLRQSEYISDAVATIGDNSEVEFMLEPQTDSLATWARTTGVRYSSLSSLLEHPAVGELFAGEAARLSAEHLADGYISRIDLVEDFSELETDGNYLYTESGKLSTEVVRRLIRANQITPRRRPIPAAMVAKTQAGKEKP